VLLEIKDISVVVPQRKKYTLCFTETHLYARLPDSSEPVPGISYAWKDIGMCDRIPPSIRTPANAFSLQNEYSTYLCRKRPRYNITTFFSHDTPSSRRPNLPQTPLPPPSPSFSPFPPPLPNPELSQAAMPPPPPPSRTTTARSSTGSSPRACAPPQTPCPSSAQTRNSSTRRSGRRTGRTRRPCT
jgi:hypothetical protein